MTTQQQKACPNCGMPFAAKRLNQYYCDAACRIQSNNHQSKIAREQHNEITQLTHAILWRNREALRRCLPKQESTLEELFQHGFQTNYITHFEQVPGKTSLFFCYDYAYAFVNSSTVQIFHHDSSK